MRRFNLLLVIAGLASLASAQERDAEPPVVLADEIARSVESSFDCAVSIHGEPRLYELSAGWYVAYSASGDECDEASQTLRARGEEHELFFSRRPNRGQLRALLAGMVRSAELTSGCRITIGETRLNEPTGQWFVTYLAAGTNCDEASQELWTQGAELDIHFWRRQPPGGLRNLP